MSCSSICRVTCLPFTRRLDAIGQSFQLSALKFGVLAIVAVTVFSGCQQLGFRSGEHELLVNPETDDWSLPDSSGRVPRPNFGNTRGRSVAGGYDPSEPVERVVLPKDRKKPAVQAKISEATTTSEAVNDPAPAAPKPQVANDSPKIIDTPNQEIDIDGALESLPPEYRSVLKQQLVAAQQRSSKPAASEMASNATAPALASQATTLPSNTETSSGGNSIAASTEPKKSGVSFKISEGNVTGGGSASSDVASAQLASNSPPSNAPANTAPSVQQASFNGVAAAESSKTLANDSGVQPASGFDVAHLGVNAINTNTANVVPNPALQPATSLSPTAGASPATWHQSLTQTIEMLEKQIAESPPADENLRIHQEVTLRMLYVAQRRLEDSVRRIDFLADDEEDYFVHQMQALYEASNPDATPVRSRRWSLVMNSQREATNRLGAASNLEVRSAAFCTDVQGYGVISKFPKYSFSADQDVLLYCELENVAASEVKVGNETHFETQLQGSYQIIDADGKTIADQLLPMEPEVCKNHRRDYFMVYKIYMPQQIAAGNYKLKLTIEDLKGRKFGHASLDLQIKK